MLAVTVASGDVAVAAAAMVAWEGVAVAAGMAVALVVRVAAEERRGDERNVSHNHHSRGRTHSR